MNVFETKATRTVLAVTPSPAAPEEVRFWSGLARSLEARDALLVTFTTRAFEDYAPAKSVLIPANLVQFAVDARSAGHRQQYRIPQWLDQSTLWRHVDWEHQRRGVTNYQPLILEGIMRLASFVNEVTRRSRPAIVLTTNKIDHRCAFFRAAGHHFGALTGVIERSPFDSIWFEPDGLFAESEIWSLWESARVGTRQESIGAEMRARIRDNPAGFRAAEVSWEREDLSSHRRPLVFVPMDNAIWTGWSSDGHPQGLLDNPVFPSPVLAIQRLSAWVQRQGGTLLIKPHPADIYVPKLPLPANTHIVDGDISHLIGEADLTVTFNTKLAFVAIAAGVRPVTLADNPAAASGLTTHWRDYSTAEDALNHGLTAEPPPVSDVDRFFGWLGSEYFYEPEQRLDQSGPEELAERLLSEAPESSQSASSMTVTIISDLVTGCLPYQRDSTPLQGTGGSGRRRVILDVTRLAHPQTLHSGITRYGRELLAHYQERDDLEVWALLTSTGRPWQATVGSMLNEIHAATSGRVIHVEGTNVAGAVQRECGPLSARDIYHSIQHPLPSQRISGGPTRILTIHDILHLKYPEFHHASGPPTIAKVIDSIDVSGDFLICDSDQTRRDVLSIVPIETSRTRVVPLGVASARHQGIGPWYPRPGFPRDYVTALVQREARKNGEALIQGIAQGLRAAQLPDLGVVLFTSGDEQRHLSEWNASVLDVAMESGLTRQQLVIMAGPSDEEMLRVFAGARAFVFASKYEGFGLPPLEAMAAGCPVVVPANSSLIEVTGGAACYAAGTSDRDLAEALRMVLTTPAYASGLIEEGRRRADELSWSATAAATAELYAEVAG